jgi:flagellar motor switch protein FliM
VFFGEVETALSILVASDFLYEFIPSNTDDVVPIDSESWRTAIEAQVVDSSVTVCVSLPEISIKASDLVALKNGDLIPIGDPTLVYVCLNNTRLFCGNAGQANSSRVVKILSEI